jgi:hypothetical protein
MAAVNWSQKIDSKRGQKPHSTVETPLSGLDTNLKPAKHLLIQEEIKCRSCL